MKIPDLLYWKLRHSLIFMMNIPAYPIHATYWLIRHILTQLIGCFTCNGSTQICPFWEWQWLEDDE